MFNEHSIKQCNQAIFGNQTFGSFYKPLYDSYCFSRIPHTISKLLLGTNEQALPTDTHTEQPFGFVVLFLIDSFGWQIFEKQYKKYPFLARFVEQGIASKITSQFPSTTTNHVTCMHTGLDVGSSGLYEWFMYDPVVDASICPLHYSYAKDHGLNTLLKAGYESKKLFNFPSFYDYLRLQSVRSTIFQHKSLAHSPYSQALLGNTTVVTFKNLAEGLNRLRREITHCQKTVSQDKNYFFFYYGDIDGLGHKFGPESPEVQAEVEKTFTRLERFWQELQTSNKRGCCIVTADHGMAKIIPEHTWFLNRAFPNFEQYLKRTKANEPIVPCGSSRDFFLHIQEPYLDLAYDKLSQALDGIGAVYKTTELVKAGLFSTPSERLLERIGNLVLLPYETNSIWWYEKDRFENPYHGHHGGLSKDELHSIFLFLEIE